MADEVSLGAFLLARLDEDMPLVIDNMPLVVDESLRDPVFCDRFLDRGAVFRRLQGDRAVVAACVAEMQKAQGPPPVPKRAFADPATVLGSQVVKLLAERYRNHPDYNPEWLAQ